MVHNIFLRTTLSSGGVVLFFVVFFAFMSQGYYALEDSVQSEELHCQ